MLSRSRVACAVAAVFLVAGCDEGSKPRTAARPTACGTHDGTGCAPPDRRVDLEDPAFSHSIEITNPLFPISRLRSALFLGHVDGRPFRTETTLLPGTQTVEWNGARVRVRVSQYLAYLDGRITEVALDRYAQADDGSVWYFGEDVFDYANGTVAATEGTWLAGKEGPPAMIMPAHPKVGDVYRTENALGVVFEEVTVKSTNLTVDGPLGRVRGGIVVDELHADGGHEDKVFAPGYGEFRTAGDGDLEALALGIPADSANEPMPPQLRSLEAAAVGVLELSRLRDWEAASALTRRATDAWATLARQPQPRTVVSRLSQRLEALTTAVANRNAQQVAQPALDVAQSVLDLQLRYRSATEVDVDRFRLGTQQLRVDASANDPAGVTGAVAVLEWMRERFRPVGGHELDAGLRALRAASDARNLPAAADHAARLAALLREG
jgi:hypothetical protein